MTTLLSRILGNRCTRCQVGQGRMCQCQGGAKIRNGKRQRFEISSSQFWVTTIVALAGFWTVVVWRVLEAVK